MNERRSHRLWLRLLALEEIAGLSGICPHGPAVIRERSLARWTWEGGRRVDLPEEEPPVCELCHLPKQIIRIVPARWPPEQV
jgi:hypothetical protein